MRDALIFPLVKHEKKKKNPNPRITYDGKQQLSKKAFLLYTSSSIDK